MYGGIHGMETRPIAFNAKRCYLVIDYWLQLYEIGDAYGIIP